MQTTPMRWRCAAEIEPTAESDDFIVDHRHRTVDLWWGGYEYSIAWARIDTPTKLLAWLSHLGSTKTWPGITPRRMARLIAVLDRHFGWEVRP